MRFDLPDAGHRRAAGWSQHRTGERHARACAHIQQRQTSGFTREAAGREPWATRNPFAAAPPPVAPPPKTEVFDGEAAVGSFKTGPCALSSNTHGDHSRPVSRGGPQPCRPRRPRLGPCVTVPQARPTRATRLPPTSPRGVRSAGTLPRSEVGVSRCGRLIRSCFVVCQIAMQATAVPRDVDVQRQSQRASQKRSVTRN